MKSRSLPSDPVPLKVVFVIKALSVAGGGAERVLAEITSALAARGHDVSVLSFDPADAEDFYPISPGVRRARLRIRHPYRRLGMWSIIGRVSALRAFARRLQPDVVVGFMHSTYIPLGFALAGTGIPVIASEHIVYDHYRTMPLHALLLRGSVPLFAGFTAISEKVRSNFPKKIAARMTAIPNPVVSARGLRADPAGGRQKILLTVGRFMRQKNQEVLIAAFARLAAQYPEWQLRIVGEGELRPELERQVAQRGLEDRIELPGTTADIGREYAQAQLFVMPSLYESFGLATAEALAHGLPAVGFANCPGTNELIQDGINGRLAAGPEPVSALADALDELMSSAELRVSLGAAGPASISRFTVDAIARQWETLLKSVVTSRAEFDGRRESRWRREE